MIILLKVINITITKKGITLKIELSIPLKCHRTKTLLPSLQLKRVF